MALVLLSRPVMTGVKRILVPLDFSPGSRCAVEYAALFARTLDASVVLLHVGGASSLIEAIVPGARVEDDARREEFSAQAAMEEIAAILTAEGAPHVETLFSPGPIVPTILAQAAAGNFSMIVMGTHGRTGVRSWVLGSVAEGVIRRASCPVLTVHIPFE